jgi:hypothetical protein
MNIELTTPIGLKVIDIAKFPAMDGWDLQEQFVRFAASTDREFRRAYTLEVLSYATVLMDDGGRLPLSTDALINNHLGSWENVKAVFEEVLMQNGINPKTHADRPTYWSDAGAQMATAFIASTSELLGPAFEMLTKQRTE